MMLTLVLFPSKTSNEFQFTVLLGHDRDGDNKEDNDNAYQSYSLLVAMQYGSS